MVSRNKMPCGRDTWCDAWFCMWCCVDGSGHSPEDIPRGEMLADAGDGEASTPSPTFSGFTVSAAALEAEEEAQKYPASCEDAELGDLTESILDVSGVHQGPRFILTPQRVGELMRGGCKSAALSFLLLPYSSSPPEAPRLCSSYDRKTRRCTKDGTVICMYPDALQCLTRDER